MFIFELHPSTALDFFKLTIANPRRDHQLYTFSIQNDHNRLPNSFNF